MTTYVFAEPEARKIALKRCITKGILIFALVAGAIVIVVRVSNLDPMGSLLMVLFLVAFGVVRTPLTAKRMVAKLSKSRYEVAAFGLRVRRDDADDAQVICWPEVTAFRLIHGPAQSFVSLSTSTGSVLRIDHADLFRSDSGDAPLPLAIARHLAHDCVSSQR